MYINTPEKKIKRSLGILMLTVIGVSGTVGGSIFVLLSGGIELAGAYTPHAYLLAGVLAMLGGLLYAEVGTTIPRPGAGLSYVFSAFKNRHYPFLFSWTILLGDLGYLAINAIGFGFYLGLVLNTPPVLVALIAIALSVAINLRGLEKAGKMEISVLATLLLLFAAFGVYVSSSPNNFAPLAFDELRISGVIAATALLFTSFIGYEYIATMAGEAKNAARSIPIAMVATVTISTLVFSGVAYITLIGAPMADLAASDAPLLLVGETIGGLSNAIIIPAALLATSGSLIAATMVASRRLFAISEEGFFGAYVQKTNKYHIPSRALIICGVLAAALVTTQAVNFVAYMSNAVYLMSLITIASSVIILRRKRPYLDKPFKAPLYPIIPFIIIGLALTLIAFIDVASIALVVIWLTIGWFTYLLGSIDNQRWQLLVKGAAFFLFFLLLTILISSYTIFRSLLTQ